MGLEHWAVCVDDGLVVGDGNVELMVGLDGFGLAGPQLCWQLAVLAVCALQRHH